MKIHSTSISVFVIAFTSTLLGVGSVWSGEAEMKQFQELKAKYQALLAAKPAYDALQKRLGEMERKFAGERNYDAAHKIRQERLSLAKEQGVKLTTSAGTQPTEDNASVSADGAVNLPTAAASLSGGVERDAATGILKNWTTRGAVAEWALPANLPQGAYRVEVDYACVAGSGGGVGLKEAQFSSTRTVRETGGWDQFKSVSLGTLRLQAGSLKFQILAQTPAGEGLWLVKSVRLLPPNAQ